MVDPVPVVKSRARILRRRVRDAEPEALKRARILPEFRDRPATEIAVRIRHRHCLSVIARELGFSSWTHAHHLLDGENPSDFGTLLCPPGSSAHWNIWCASYDEARRIREEHGGFLLGYRHQFLITDRHFIEHLGLDPDDEDWQRIGRDWVRPADPHARRRLYGRLIEATAPAG